jgi:O-antigen ligase
MKFTELQLEVCSFLDEKHYFLITYFFFLFGFFVIPSTHWHNNIFYAFILFPYLLTLRLRRIQLICPSNIWVLSMVLACYMCFTLLWAEHVVFKDYIYYIRRVIYLFVFLSVTIELALRYPKFIDYLFVFLCWVAALTAIASILWFYSSNSFPLKRLQYLGDQVRNSIVGASAYGMVAIVCCFYFLKTKKSYAWIYTMLSVVILFSVTLTQSRGPLGALLVTFLMGAIITRNKKLLVMVLCVILFEGLMFFCIEEFKEIIIKRGLSYRYEIFQQILPRIKAALIFGEGISTDTTFIMADGSKWNHPHNVYVGTTLYGGLTGLFLFFILQVMALWEALLCFIRENDFTYMALLVFAFICIIVSDHRVISHPDALWIYLWLPLALVAAKRLSRNENAISFYQDVGRTKRRE